MEEYLKSFERVPGKYIESSEKVPENCYNLMVTPIQYPHAMPVKPGQKFGTSPVGMNWDRKHMIPTQSQLFAIPSPD